ELYDLLLFVCVMKYNVELQYGRYLLRSSNGRRSDYASERRIYFVNSQRKATDTIQDITEILTTMTYGLDPGIVIVVYTVFDNALIMPCGASFDVQSPRQYAFRMASFV